MDDQELDIFFMDLLKKILADLEECQDYVKDKKSPEYKEIQEDYAESIKILNKVIKSIKGIDDLALSDEETINEVYEFIQLYADNFIINEETEQNKKDLEEYAKVEEILDLFLDDEDWEEEEII
ncbi:MAG: hypothetical protein K5866_03910 [Treponema sp.]|nr:hypothetical protein [Treponema sp.]